jgi:uncharacterized membrane protein
MTTTPSVSPPPMPDAALLEAARRAERLAEHGPTVHGPSSTGVLAVSAALLTLAVPVVVSGERWWFGPVILSALGLVLAVRTWFVARRRHTLQPLWIASDERPFAVLDPQRRRLLRPQFTGRVPVTAAAVPLVAAWIRWQRRSSREAVPGLVALGAVLVGSSWGLTLSSGDVWFLVLLLVVAVFITVMTAIEARRRERVLRSLPDRSSSPAPTTCPIA